ncbi:hypothetical protein LTR17_022506 [Elasticomyces elasticus]|nr:hypothetical protein LTR17_022506 [Elasticomyces elasticus]
MIHPDLPGVVVTLVVDSQDLPEYDEDDDDNVPLHTCVKYVEAVSGAEFGVAVRFDPSKLEHPDDTVATRVSFDGQSAGTTFYASVCTRQPRRWFIRGAICDTPQGRASQAMMFSELTINEGKPDSALFGKVGDLGTIRVELFKSVVEQLPPSRQLANIKHQKGGKNDAVLNHPAMEPLVVDGNVSEKTLKGKALTHQAMTCASHIHIQVSIKRYDTVPYAKAEKSLLVVTAALQALHILQRTPTPVPLEERPVEDLLFEERGELLRRQKAKEASQADREVKQETKRERGVDDGDIEVVKHVSKKARMSNDIEVVDLSFDD